MNTISNLNHYKSAYIVEFADRYAINGNLLGKNIVICESDDMKVSISFPSIIKEKDGYLDLGMPNLYDSYGIGLNYWGKINGYEEIDNPSSIDAWISAISVECFSSKPFNDSSIIQGYGKKLIHALQIINPSAIRILNDDQPNIICKVALSACIGESGMPKSGITHSCVIDDSFGQISISDIKLGIMNMSKNISVPYELLDNARINLSHHDTRATVLNSATAIEIVLKAVITKHLDNSKVPFQIKKLVLDKADGYSNLVDLCKKFSLPYKGEHNLQKTVIGIRNRVIHGGYTPEYQEALTAYNDTRSTLIALDIPMFE